MSKSSEELDKHGIGHEHEEVFDPTPYRPGKKARLGAIMGMALVCTGLLFAGALPRVYAHNEAIEDAKRRSSQIPKIAVMRPTHARGNQLKLPGTLTPFQETVVYARVSGYLKNYGVDIGDKVKRGQVMAVIDTPDLDQEINQTLAQVQREQAAVQEADAKLQLARVTNARYASLIPNKFVSQQAGDEAQARLQVEESAVAFAKAALASAEASARHLHELKNFATLIAPFDGVVTSRTTEEGQLVTVGMDTGQAIFKVARTEIMRMFVSVPQLYVPSVKTGCDANVTVREFPNRIFPGRVSRTTHELNTATRMLMTQVDVANSNDELIAGMYAQAVLPIDRSDAPLSIAASALLFDADGTRVAIVEDGAIHWRPIRIDGDAGATITVASGLTEDSNVVIAPSGQLTEGLKVQSYMTN